jgi:hypothetical protein
MMYTSLDWLVDLIFIIKNFEPAHLFIYMFFYLLLANNLLDSNSVYITSLDQWQLECVFQVKKVHNISYSQKKDFAHSIL